MRLRGAALQRRRCRPGNGGERRQAAARFGAQRQLAAAAARIAADR